MVKTLTKSSTPAKAKKSNVHSFTVGITTPITVNNGGMHICTAVEAMSELGFKIYALAEGDEHAQNECFNLLEKYPNNFEVLESVSQNRDSILEKSDVVLFPTMPEASVLKGLQAQKIVVIAPEGCGIENFNPQRETGNGFTFLEGNFWSMMASIIRASENMKFKYDWNTLKKNIEKSL